MGCSYAKCLFDPPVHRCCSCCPPCIRMCDVCCGNKNLPDQVAALPKNDGYVLELTTKSGATTYMWCHERPQVRTPADDSRFDLIYSHGRLEDIGFPPIRMFLRALSRRLKINCYLYEFVGFYRASGEPSEEAANESIEAALDKVATLGTNNNVILMGHSLGCGPTVYLAAKPSSKQQVLLPGPYGSRDRCGVQVAGVILKSTFTSVCAAICCPMRILCCCKEGCHRECCSCRPSCDNYRNIDLMPLIEMIDHTHADLLSAACQDPYPIWKMKEDGHAAFPKDSKLFFKLMDEFLEHCSKLRAAETQPNCVAAKRKGSSNDAAAATRPKQPPTSWEDLATQEHEVWCNLQVNQQNQVRGSAPEREEAQTGCEFEGGFRQYVEVAMDEIPEEIEVMSEDEDPLGQGATALAQESAGQK